MRLAPLKIFAAAAVLSAVGIVSGTARAGGDTTLGQIAGYRYWARVTREPVFSNVETGGG
jgi:hypothetical protein